MKFYRKFGPIQAMTFDLDDTLYDNLPIILRVEAKVKQWFHTHHPISATRSSDWWKDIKRQVLVDDKWLQNDVTAWRRKQVSTGLIQLGYNEHQANQAADALIEQVLIHRSDFIVPEITHKVLAQLAAQIPLVAITNGNVNIEKIGLAPYFAQVYKAGPDGYAKPHRQLFDKAVGFLNLPSASVLHVGDHLMSDVLGAKHSGLSACWFNDQGKHIREHSAASILPDVEVAQLQDLLLLIGTPG